LVNSRAGAIAGALTLSILLYDLPLKQTRLAPALMGACRALNLLMGMSRAPELTLPHILLPCAGMFLYVTSVTFLARREASAAPVRRSVFAYLAVFLGPMSLGLMIVVTPDVQAGYLPGLAMLLLAVAVTTSSLAAESNSGTVQAGIKWLVLWVIGFDACVASSTRGLEGAMLVSALFIPAIGLAKRLRVT
jgi:4-hydroxybenzoate polyprenyltransferase